MEIINMPEFMVFYPISYICAFICILWYNHYGKRACDKTSFLPALLWSILGPAVVIAIVIQGILEEPPLPQQFKDFNKWFRGDY